MKIEDANFFFKNYVGRTPDDHTKVLRTEDMIKHYIDSGLKDSLLKIYEYGCKDEELNTKNIPRKLWQEDNLINPDEFYLHDELYLTNPMPIVDPVYMSVKTTPYFHETKEKYTMNDLLLYIDSNLKRTSCIQDHGNDIGSIKYLFNKYKGLKSEGIHPIDMILFLIDYHAGESIRIIDLNRDDETVLRQVKEFDNKLKSIGKHKIQWRGSLGDE